MISEEAEIWLKWNIVFSFKLKKRFYLGISLMFND